MAAIGIVLYLSALCAFSVLLLAAIRSPIVKSKEDRERFRSE